MTADVIQHQGDITFIYFTFIFIYFKLFKLYCSNITSCSFKITFIHFVRTEKKVSALTKEIKSLQKSKGTSSEEYNARKLYEENEFLKAQLDRTSRR